MDEFLTTTGDIDLTIWGLVLQADIVVKAVLVVLVLASVWSWAVIIQKMGRLRYLKRKASQFEQTFWSGGSLEELHRHLQSRPDHPLAAVFVSGMNEWQRSVTQTERQRTIAAGLSERIGQVMHVTVTREMDALERNVGFLATVGSTAPFVGLFGTVWGIMNSFQSIAVSQDTSLAVVAPGIAEALFATALGLLAAIPAVVAYNKISSDLNRYAARLETFASELGALLSRHIDENHT